MKPAISERELWACAQKTIDRYAGDAELVAAARAGALSAEGDLEGQRVWLAIRRRILAWRRTRLPAHVN